MLQLLGMRRAHGNRQTRSYDAIGAQHAYRKVGDMHGSALAAVEAGGFAKKLGHHAVHARTFGQGVAMAAVGGGQVVAGAQVGAHAGGHGFLPGGQVQRTSHPNTAGSCLPISAHAALAGDFGCVLKRTYAHHGAVKAGQRLPCWGWCHASLSCPDVGRMGDFKSVES